MRGLFALSLILAPFLSTAALSQVPTNPVQSADRLQVANCVRQGLATSPACIGLVAVPCVGSASGDRREAEITCARREEAVWRERLTLAGATLERTLEAGARSQFAALQLAWQSYAVQKCAFYGASQPPTRSAGLQAGCELREVAERALEVERFAARQTRRPPAAPPQIIR
ncbi:lysozyme inhibitor LprI family protein [Bosea vestrisii]|uniref:lysozyme inhibitor LprI family protein n=1 Tax=Bosea vestrisii TaxID=151416 RepID=UPI0024DFC166|nr:lysozyme inhibitor LprI family protein [Bosea vestrisii]WID97332.1 lysozyme inhibitor LprI family protein [Bosea vestrisii]